MHGLSIKYNPGEKIGKCYYVYETDRVSVKRRAKFRCVCGNEFDAQIDSVKSFKTTSCGCINKQSAIRTGKKNIKHGLSMSKIYSVWKSAKRRCLDKNCISYKNYGARGISMCDEWRGDFMAFYNHIITLRYYGEPGRSIDRINNDGNYEPGNIRWATRTQQNNNQRRSKKYVNNL